MISALLLATGLLVATPPERSGDVREYEAARKRVGTDPIANIKLALWCESRGLEVERNTHLSIAHKKDPKNTVARGLLGLVERKGAWLTLEAICGQVAEDRELSAALKEYDSRRSRLADTADGNWKLALWCEQNGLKAEAQAHFTVITRLDPSRDAVWKRLGYKKIANRRVTDLQLSAEKSDAVAQKKSDKQWKPLLTKWRGWLGEEDKRAEAERLLAEVTDPLAVRAVWSVFVGNNAQFQHVAVQLLDQIEGVEASRALALLALLSASSEVQNAAIQALKPRDPREYVGLLIARLRDPVKYEVRRGGGQGSVGVIVVDGQPFNPQALYTPPPITTPLVPGQYVTTGVNGQTGLVGGFGYTSGQGAYGNDSSLNWWAINNLNQAAAALVQSSDAQVLSRATAGMNTSNFAGSTNHLTGAPNSAAPAAHLAAGAPAASGGNRSSLGVSAGGQAPIGPLFGFGTNVQAAEEEMRVQQAQQQALLAARQSAAASQEQFRIDIGTLDEFNKYVRNLNDRIAKILSEATGRTLPGDPKALKRWWIKVLGYKNDSISERRKAKLLVGAPSRSGAPAEDTADVTGDEASVSCFGAGTPVRTLTGPRPIESLQIGDQVLTQNARSGALRFQPILDVHQSSSSPTLRIKAGDDTIIAGPCHRFWVSGEGWVLARELREGDSLRTLGGVGRVAVVEPGGSGPVFNIDVAEDADFFAGESALLAHDNTLPDMRIAPFDSASSLSSSTRSSN